MLRNAKYHGDAPVLNAFLGEKGRENPIFWHFFKEEYVTGVCCRTSNGHGLGWAMPGACLSPFGLLFLEQINGGVFSPLPHGETSKRSFCFTRNHDKVQNLRKLL